MPTAAPATDEARPEPPVARKAPQVTEMHGEQLVDPYAWLRQREDPEVLAHLKAENAYTQAMMAHTEPLQGTLYEEMVGRIQETDLTVPVLDDGYFYYSRTEEGKQYPTFCRKKDSLEAEEEVILDSNELAEGHDFFRIGVFAVSPDHSLLAFAYDTDGSEEYLLRIKNLETGELEDSVPGISTSLAWALDNRTLFYTVRDAANRPYQVLRHRLGTDASQDEVVIQEDNDAFFVSVNTTRDEQYLLFGLGSSTTTEVRYLPASEPFGTPQIIQPRRQGVEYDVDHHSGTFYVRTNEDAKNFRLLQIPVEGLEGGRWQEVIPHREHVVLERMELFAQHLVTSQREAGQRQLWIRTLATGEEHSIEMPEPLYGVFLSSNPDFDTTTLRLSYTSQVTPRSVYDYAMDRRELVLRKQRAVLGDFDPENYFSERIYARAQDGLAIPVSLVYRRDLKRDGSAPCLLLAYGSYGITIDPFFSSTRLSLLDRGFVFAVAHVRGGGFLGEQWHDNGKLMEKKNTFTDVVAVAEHLVAQRYTSQERLGLEGGSAGGLLVGAVLNLRPDLFQAAHAAVPFVDVINTMRDPSLPLTVIEYEEWGNPEDEAAFRYILSYSPYENVGSKEYPHLLVTAGLNDARVSYWEPAKWVARLRAEKTDNNRLMLRTNMGAGHGGASGRYESLKETAFEYAFFLDALGVEP